METVSAIFAFNWSDKTALTGLTFPAVEATLPCADGRLVENDSGFSKS